MVGSGSETAGPKSSLCCHLLRAACGFGNNYVLGGGRVHMHHDFSLGLLFGLGVKLPLEQKAKQAFMWPPASVCIVL